MWERMKKKVTSVPAHVNQTRDYRLKGKTHRGSSDEGPKKMKEVASSRVSAKVVTVKKREHKEGPVPGVGGKVNPGDSGRKKLGEKGGNIESKREGDSQANDSLASGGKDSAVGEMFVMSKSRKQMWERMKKNMASAPPLVQSVHVDQMRDYRTKGKTFRTGEVPDDRAKQILRRRQRNDSKPGGLSKSRMFGKKHPELGGNRGFRRPYRERPDRPFNFDEDEEEPSM